jgi:hypothetical protein
VTICPSNITYSNYNNYVELRPEPAIIPAVIPVAAVNGTVCEVEFKPLVISLGAEQCAQLLNGTMSVVPQLAAQPAPVTITVTICPSNITNLGTRREEADRAITPVVYPLVLESINGTNCVRNNKVENFYFISQEFCQVINATVTEDLAKGPLVISEVKSKIPYTKIEIEKLSKVHTIYSSGYTDKVPHPEKITTVALSPSAIPSSFSSEAPAVSLTPVHHVITLPGTSSIPDKPVLSIPASSAANASSLIADNKVVPHLATGDKKQLATKVENLTPQELADSVNTTLSSISPSVESKNITHENSSEPDFRPIVYSIAEQKNRYAPASAFPEPITHKMHSTHGRDIFKVLVIHGIPQKELIEDFQPGFDKIKVSWINMYELRKFRGIEKGQGGGFKLGYHYDENDNTHITALGANLDIEVIGHHEFTNYDIDFSR